MERMKEVEPKRKAVRSDSIFDITMWVKSVWNVQRWRSLQRLRNMNLKAVCVCVWTLLLMCVSKWNVRWPLTYTTCTHLALERGFFNVLLLVSDMGRKIGWIILMNESTFTNTDVVIKAILMIRCSTVTTDHQQGCCWGWIQWTTSTVEDEPLVPVDL